MEYRTLEITIQYAKDLNKVNLISKMDVYVVVSISGGDKNSKQKTKTAVDHDGDANPMWKYPMKFVVEEAALLQNRLMLDFKLKCERALGDKDIGEAHVPIKDLLDFPAKGRGGAKKFVSYQVKKPSGKPKGYLTFSYQFHEKAATFLAPLPPVAEVHGGSMMAYPVLEPSLLFPAAAPEVYPPPPSHPVTVTAYPPPASYPPAGGPTPECYPPPPGDGWAAAAAAAAGYMHRPELGFGYPPPLMQLTPNWWIVDWRYDSWCYCNN